MTRITRSGARSGPISPARSQRRGGVRREQRASTSTAAQQEVEGTEEEEEEASQDTPLEAPLSQLSVQANSVQADLSQCGACLDWFHKDGRSGNHQETASLQSQKALATVPEEHAEHQRLSELGGVGYVFEQCHKGLCSGCFHSYLVTRINDAKTGISLAPLSCAECRKLPIKPECVSTEQVQAVLSDAELEEYQRQIVIGTFKKKFFCPHPNCSAVFDAEDIELEAHWDQPNTTQVACPECKKTACLDCACAWHTGFSCDEYKSRPLFIRDKEDELAMELATNRNWRRCPKKGCGHTIELSEGCNHITCICGKEWCYLCLHDWITEKDSQGNITQQYCARKDKGGPKCPLYTEDSILGRHGQGFRQQRHTMAWISDDRSAVPYQKANTFTRHLLASRKCGYCNVKCKSKRNLIAHLETANHDVFDCCAKFFKNRADFDAHVFHSHPSRQWVSGELALRVRRL